MFSIHFLVDDAGLAGLAITVIFVQFVVLRSLIALTVGTQLHNVRLLGVQILDWT
jgi:hypothetical protein